jgi:hypothetical protein
MEYKTNSIASRIQWCQRQKTQARTQLEREGWQSELEGLCDALLNRRVHTTQYQDRLPGVFKRYVVGFEDGQTLIHAGAVAQQFATPPIGHMFDTGSIQETEWGRSGASFVSRG